MTDQLERQRQHLVTEMYIAAELDGLEFCRACPATVVPLPVWASWDFEVIHYTDCRRYEVPIWPYHPDGSRI